LFTAFDGTPPVTFPFFLTRLQHEPRVTKRVHENI
jgi:hypothetical protein